jgi:hypothetical protein
VGVIVYYVEGKMGVGDAFLARHSCLKAKKEAALIWAAALFGLLSLLFV